MLCHQVSKLHRISRDAVERHRYRLAAAQGLAEDLAAVADD
jgi:hypothetical protein